MTGVIGALGGMFPVATITVALNDQSVSKAGAGSQTAAYILNSGGTITNQDATVLETWLLTGAASAFEVRATVLSGTTPGGPVGSWVACSTTRTWSLTDSLANGVAVSCSLTIEIRNASTLAVLDSATVSITAERTV